VIDGTNKQSNPDYSGYDTGLFVSDVTTDVSVLTTLCYYVFLLYDIKVGENDVSPL
jgi:hypothetical protein